MYNVTWMKKLPQHVGYLHCILRADSISYSLGALPYIRDITGLQTGRHTVTISAKSVSGGSARSAILSFNTQGLLFESIVEFNSF